MIILNSFVILLSEVPPALAFVNDLFPYAEHTLARLLPAIDNACSWYFIFEFLLKASVFSLPVYFRNRWNWLDFSVVMATLPLVISRLIQADLEALSFFSLLRLGRFLRFFRIVRALRMMLVFRTLWKGFTAIQLPIMTGLVVVGIRLGIMTVVGQDVLENHPTVDMVISRGFAFLFTITAGWLIIRFLNAIYEEFLVPLAAKTTTKLDDLVLPFAQSILRAALWGLTLIAALKSAGYDVGVLLSALGLAGLAFALAARDLLANIIGGLNIFIKRPFKVNDRVQMAGFEGRVTGIGLGTTHLTDVSGRVVALPNKYFTEGYVINLDAQPSAYMHLTLHLRHDTGAEAIETALQVLNGLCMELEHIDNDCRVSFDAIGASSLEIHFRYGIERYNHARDHASFGDEDGKIAAMKTRMNLAIMHAFEQHGITLALPAATY